jgi:hypothetical protein
MPRAIPLSLLPLLITTCSLPGRLAAAPVTAPAATTRPPSPSATVASPSQTPPGLEATPGILLRGTVKLRDGTGLADVSICRSFASYGGRKVAQTDRDGIFSSEFTTIPGDEMVTVWPYRAGFTFQPESMYWRHYHGFEDAVFDFVASPGEASGPFPADCE